jgi:hypothetical protein
MLGSFHAYGFGGADGGGAEASTTTDREGVVGAGDGKDIDVTRCPPGGIVATAGRGADDAPLILSGTRIDATRWPAARSFAASSRTVDGAFSFPGCFAATLLAADGSAGWDTEAGSLAAAGAGAGSRLK